MLYSTQRVLCTVACLALFYNMAHGFFLSLQTFLEQTKTKFSKNYKGMSLSKITTTVGLNSK